MVVGPIPGFHQHGSPQTAHCHAKRCLAFLGPPHGGIAAHSSAYLGLAQLIAVDAFRRLPLDWSFVGKGVGERIAMKELIERMPFQPGDVAIMDRGFPSKSCSLR